MSQVKETEVQQARIQREVYSKLKTLGILADEKAATVSGQPLRPHLPTPLRPEDMAGSNERSVRNRKRAEANRKWYIEQESKTGKPWMHCVRDTEQYGEFVLVDPRMAGIALDFNFGNRKLKKRKLESYTRDVENHRWIDTGEAIEFDESGCLYNGQHRMQAVINSNTACVFWVVFNCPVEARFGVDQGAIRSAADKINLVVRNNVGNKLPAVCRAMMRGLTNVGVTFSQPEITQFALKYGPTVEWAAKACPRGRADVVAVVAKAVLWYGVDAVEPFCKRFSELMFSSKDDPAKRLYEFLINGKDRGSGIVVYKRTLAAIEHHINGKSIRALFDRDKDIFEWDDNWEVPRPKA